MLRYSKLTDVIGYPASRKPTALLVLTCDKCKKEIKGAHALTNGRIIICSNCAH